MNINSRKKLIFDFDGTIANTLDLLVDIYNKIYNKYGCLPVDINDKEELKKLKTQEILKKYKISFLKIPFLLMRVRRELKKRISEVRIYSDINLVLKELKKRGFDLYILTSNSKKNVEVFLKNNDLLNIFEFIYSSSNVFGKDRSIKNLLKSRNINKEDCIYIGDETRDIEAMKRINFAIIAVSWGFNSRDALIKLKPYKVIENPKELLSLYF